MPIFSSRSPLTKGDVGLTKTPNLSLLELATLLKDVIAPVPFYVNNVQNNDILVYDSSVSNPDQRWVNKNLTTLVHGSFNTFTATQAQGWTTASMFISPGVTYPVTTGATGDIRIPKHSGNLVELDISSINSNFTEYAISGIRYLDGSSIEPGVELKLKISDTSTSTNIGAHLLSGSFEGSINRFKGSDNRSVDELNINGSVTASGLSFANSSYGYGPGMDIVDGDLITLISTTSNQWRVLSWPARERRLTDRSMYGTIKDFILTNQMTASDYFDGTGLGIGFLEGWALCNGANGTFDLRGRCTVHQGTGQTLRDTVGAESVNVSTQHLPSHRHEEAVPFPTKINYSSGGLNAWVEGTGASSPSRAGGLSGTLYRSPGQGKISLPLMQPSFICYKIMKI